MRIYLCLLNLSFIPAVLLLSSAQMIYSDAVENIFPQTISPPVYAHFARGEFGTPLPLPFILPLPLPPSYLLHSPNTIQSLFSRCGELCCFHPIPPSRDLKFLLYFPFYFPTWFQHAFLSFALPVFFTHHLF